MVIHLIRRRNLIHRFGDFTGAFGDLGVLLPLLFGLAIFNGIPFSLTLGVIGITYMVSSVVFRLPVPVQPLKVACSLALSLGLGRSVLMAASWQISLILFFFASTRWANRLASLFEKHILRGMQMGVGLILIQSGFALWAKGMRIHPAMISVSSWAWPHGSDWALAFLVLVVPQIPVTLSNAVVGSVDAARRYFRWKANRVTASRLCLSMALANLAAAVTGGIPLCHGSSGWTAHRRLGARSFFSTFFLGLIFLLIALTLRHESLTLLNKIPIPFLAGLLIYVGLRHALLIRDISHRTSSFLIALGVGLICWWTKNPSIGLGFGLLSQVSRRALARLPYRRPEKHSD